MRRTGIDHGEEREDRRLRTLANQNGQAVRQFLDRDALFKGREILGDSHRCKQQYESKGPEYAVFHRTSKRLELYSDTHWATVFRRN